VPNDALATPAPDPISLNYCPPLPPPTAHAAAHDRWLLIAFAVYVAVNFFAAVTAPLYNFIQTLIAFTFLPAVVVIAAIGVQFGRRPRPFSVRALVLFALAMTAAAFVNGHLAAEVIASV